MASNNDADGDDDIPIPANILGIGELYECYYMLL